ncbi:MAG: hypothetical protein A2X56_05125 [Nitrospirae bacterium GWC2_57_13]|nr:MAG: hypothetical protein A2072_00085 [Nitrospirae bacterium GWC1_57_7]OGW27277.1 MAG: hypothetical protein A2X56_05125 [Nitrospirae bacterium GWC2_57_13]
MRTFAACLLAAVLTVPGAAHTAGKDLAVKGVRYFSYPTFTRVVFEIESAAPYVLTKTSDGRGIVFSAYEGLFSVAASLPVINDGVIKSMEVKRDTAKPYVFVHLDAAAGEVKDFVLRSPDRIVLDISRTTSVPAPIAPAPQTSAPAATPPPPAPPQPAAQQPAAQQTPPRMVVVLDPGHGGREAGIVTAHGYEKAKSLDLAQAIKKELKKLLPDAAVVLTRDKDQSVSLAGRAAASNSAGAALFISLHFTNSKDAQVYLLGVSEGSGSQPRSAPRDFLGLEAETGKRETLWGSQQYTHAAESSSLGRTVMQQLTSRNDGGPAQAPLALLRAVDAPAILVEVGFEQNRARAAEAIARGVEAYAGKNR